MSCRAARTRPGRNERAARESHSAARTTGNDGDSLDRVPLEVAVAPPLDLQLELLDPGLGAREEERLRLRLSPEDELHLRGLRAADLVDEHAGPDGERDHRDAERREPLLQLGRHHPAFPRPPPERLHEHLRAAAGLGPRDLREDLVRHGVVGLAVVAAAGRDRREDAEELQRIVRGCGEKREQPLHLRVEDPVELLVGLLRRSSGRPGRPRRGPARRRDPTRRERGRGRRPAPRRRRRSRPRTAPRPPRPAIAARVRRISRLESTSWTRAPSSAGAGLWPWLRASARSAFFRPASSATPAQQAGSAASGVRPRRTNRARLSRAHSSMHAAVTPRAPPETTTTSPGTITGSPVATARSTLRSVNRPPDAGSATSASPPPSSSSVGERLRERFRSAAAPLEVDGLQRTPAATPGRRSSRGPAGPRATRGAGPSAPSRRRRPCPAPSRRGRAPSRAGPPGCARGRTPRGSRRSPRRRPRRRGGRRGRRRPSLRREGSTVAFAFTPRARSSAASGSSSSSAARDPDLAAAQESGLGEAGGRGRDPLQDEAAETRRGLRRARHVRRSHRGAGAAEPQLQPMRSPRQEP